MIASAQHHDLISRPVGVAPPSALIVRGRRRLLVSIAAAALAVAVAVVVAWPNVPPALAALSVNLLESGRVAIFRAPLIPSSSAPGLADGTVESISLQIDSAYALWSTWSPDGQRFLFGRGFDIFVYDVRTGASANVTNTPDRVELMPVWSPDGARISFTSRLLETGEDPLAESLVGAFGGQPSVIEVDGAGYRTLSPGFASSPPAWASDGERVAYSVDGRLWIQTLATGDASPVQADLLDRAYVGAPSWSPSDDLILVHTSASTTEPTREEVVSGAFEDISQAFVLVDTRTGDSRALYAFDAPFVPRHPGVWSSDGRRVALVFRQETAITEPIGLVILGIDGSEVLLSSSPSVAQAVWHPQRPLLAVLDDSRPAIVTVYDLESGPASIRPIEVGQSAGGIGWRSGS